MRDAAEGTAAAQLVHIMLPCREGAILWKFREQATNVTNNGGVPVNTNVANNGGVPISTNVANNGGVPISTNVAINCGVPVSTSVANNGGVPVSTSVANNGGVPVSTSSNAHNTHLNLSHPSALQPFLPQLLLHPLLPFCLQSI